jgi:hypothetical protein
MYNTYRVPVTGLTNIFRAKYQTTVWRAVHRPPNSPLDYYSLFKLEIEIGRDWYRSQNGRDLGAKVEMCTPVHGLSGFSAIDQT